MNIYGETGFYFKKKGKKNMVLFLRNWIRSGINKISDLHFVDGKVDLIYKYDIIIS